MVQKILGLSLLLLVLGATRDDDPETVFVTYRPRPGAEAELKQVISRHWDTARRLDLVRPEPHVTLELRDETRAVYFVEVFTWRDRDIPDNAPAPILSIWSEMTRLTAPRGGRPGLDIREAARIDR
jgi:hypothetical protein